MTIRRAVTVAAATAAAAATSVVAPDGPDAAVHVPASCGFGGACPPPRWPATWALNRSTALLAVNGSGLFDPALAARFGLTVFDWSDAGAVWRRGGNKSTCALATLSACRALWLLAALQL